MLENILKHITIGRGRLKNISEAKFLLDRSFTPKELLETFSFPRKVLRYVLKRMASEKHMAN